MKATRAVVGAAITTVVDAAMAVVETIVALAAAAQILDTALTIPSTTVTRGLLVGIQIAIARADLVDLQQPY